MLEVIITATLSVVIIDADVALGIEAAAEADVLVVATSMIAETVAIYFFADGEVKPRAIKGSWWRRMACICERGKKIDKYHNGMCDLTELCKAREAILDCKRKQLCKPRV